MKFYLALTFAALLTEAITLKLRNPDDESCTEEHTVSCTEENTCPRPDNEGDRGRSREGPCPEERL